MKKCVVSAPNFEGNGAWLLATFGSVKKEEIGPIFKKHGLDPALINPNQWYPVQPFFDVFKDIATGDANISENLVALGMTVGDTFPLPPVINSFRDFMQNIHAAYDIATRNRAPNDGYQVQFLSENHVVITDNTPFPSDFFFGLLWGFARRLLPKEQKFSVVPRQTASIDNDDASVFEITWGDSSG